MKKVDIYISFDGPYLSVDDHYLIVWPGESTLLPGRVTTRNAYSNVLNIGSKSKPFYIEIDGYGNCQVPYTNRTGKVLLIVKQGGFDSYLGDYIYSHGNGISESVLRKKLSKETLCWPVSNPLVRGKLEPAVG